ncbi:hypothetical protein JXR93_00860 [bacterium]|nr:hypothetical protein [bacterium]
MKEEYFLFLIDYYKGFAYYYLGYIYKYGVGKIKDLEKAKKFFEISKNFNNEHSKKELLS